MVVGDSTAAGHYDDAAHGFIVDLPNSWPAVAASLTGMAVVNLAIAGGGEIEARIAVDGASAARVDFVVYAGGTNDTANWPGSIPELTARIDDLAAHVRAKWPGAKLLFLNVRRYSGIPNDDRTLVPAWGVDSGVWARVTAWNRREAELGPVVDIQDLDFAGGAAYPDGVHPSLDQTRVLGRLVAAALTAAAGAR